MSHISLLVCMPGTFHWMPDTELLDANCILFNTIHWALFWDKIKFTWKQLDLFKACFETAVPKTRAALGLALIFPILFWISGALCLQGFLLGLVVTSTIPDPVWFPEIVLPAFIGGPFPQLRSCGSLTRMLTRPPVEPGSGGTSLCGSRSLPFTWQCFFLNQSNTYTYLEIKQSE